MKATELLKQTFAHPLSKLLGGDFDAKELEQLDGLSSEEAAAFAILNAAPAIVTGVREEHRAQARELFGLYCEAYLAALKELQT